MILSAHVPLYNEFNAQFITKIAIIMRLNIVEIDISWNREKIPYIINPYSYYSPKREILTNRRITSSLILSLKYDSWLYLTHLNLSFEGEGAIIIIMGDVVSVGLYTLNGCTYVMIKQTNDSSSGGELHLGMESFSSLMVLLKGLESELLKISFRSILILIIVLYRVTPTLYSIRCSSPRPAPCNMILVNLE